MALPAPPAPTSRTVRPAMLHAARRQRAHQADAVEHVGDPSAFAIAPERIGGADLARPRRHLVRGGKARLLVRVGEDDAVEVPRALEPLHDGGEILRRRLPRDENGVPSALRQQGVADHRRTRLSDGIADDRQQPRRAIDEAMLSHAVRVLKRRG